MVAVVFIASFPAGPWQTNCYLVAPAETGPCVVIDPGVGASDVVGELVAQTGLVPQGVLLTHGHLDHLYTAIDVCETYGVGCWIHPADRARLTDPYRIPGARELVARATGLARDFTGREPAVVHEVADHDRIALAGLVFEALHAPGHTPGSVLYRLEPLGPGRVVPAAGESGARQSGTEESGARRADVQQTEADARPLVFTGDVVFAGSVGRVDRPGPDPEAMRRTLRDVVLRLTDETVLLPGHGGQTTMSRERATNPYLTPQGLTSF
ncbi:MBL fold metallo-hydrolase [Raineyella sp.]|uniref:MBL fold metallo-hydrolase n=1 Tax=Raineyella sp. TaxID=1911550 RepID=UPI002B212AE0|nr:MBL fold metallo-hydrolase [Raineyella sp.]MEA5153553.1 MBL fold metallo-hydrolase [Raineyella sp.]